MSKHTIPYPILRLYTLKLPTFVFFAGRLYIGRASIVRTLTTAAAFELQSLILGPWTFTSDKAPESLLYDFYRTQVYLGSDLWVAGVSH